MPDPPAPFTTAFADRYRIEREIGRGGMATVYLAEDVKHHRKVAIKVLLPNLAAALGPERFLREIEIAAGLNHPHIVPLFDSGHAAGLLYFTMPYIEGESLRSRINREGRLRVEEALQIAREVAAALSFAHGRGVIHRDIKPENILLSGGEAVVADFGIARAIDAAGLTDLTGSGLAVGTLGYMSPEHAAGVRDLDPRSDIYSLGCVLYEMLVGRPPQRVLSHQSVNTGRFTDAPPEERTQLDGLPHPVERMLVRALAPRPDDRYPSVDEFAAALSGTIATRAVPHSRRVRRWAIPVLGVLAATAVAVVMLRSRAQPAPDPNVLAVAPFDVLGAELQTWREGLVDLLSGSLDGAGPLRTVSPSVVIKRWSGRADAASAAALGANLGAGLVLYGRVVGAGDDSVRLLATLHDVVANRTVAEFDLREVADRIDRLADSLAVQTMVGLSRTRSLGVWRLSSLGSSSPAALKAFLQGEQRYRRFDLDSARWYYERAIELDSAFALAHSRRAMALGWSLESDPEYLPSRLRAGAFNHGLAPRESLLLVADSITGALGGFIGDSVGYVLFGRLFSTLEYLVRRYPLDPHGWYQLGEARYHWGPYDGVTREEMREPFAQVVALDSGFVPAYRHLYELSLLLDGPAQAAPLMDMNFALADSSVFTDALRVSRALIEPERAADEGTTELLEALDPEGLYQTWYDLKWWPDSAESAVRVARAWAASPDSVSARATLGYSLAFRGHIREAREVMGTNHPVLFSFIARAGLVPRDSAARVYRDGLDHRSATSVYFGLPFWLEDVDNLALSEAATWLDSLGAEGPPNSRPFARQAATIAHAYGALVRGDTAAALEGLETVPPLPGCFVCYHPILTRARVLAGLGRYREAATILDRIPFGIDMGPQPDVVAVALERGRIQERLGNHGEAVRAYGLVVDAWRDADPELQPAVHEARAALTRLALEVRQ